MKHGTYLIQTCLQLHLMLLLFLGLPHPGWNLQFSPFYLQVRQVQWLYGLGNVHNFIFHINLNIIWLVLLILILIPFLIRQIIQKLKYQEWLGMLCWHQWGNELGVLGLQDEKAVNHHNLWVIVGLSVSCNAFVIPVPTHNVLIPSCICWNVISTYVSYICYNITGTLR